ncbi:MAG: helix-turn-helix transcriptional regulator [Anaerolineae bacterium]
MQTTRQRILSVLRERGTASVVDLAEALNVTPVAVRHHLQVLVGEALVVPVHVERYGRPGRPRQLYALTSAARGQFPDSSSTLSELLLAELRASLPAEAWEALLVRLATHLIPAEAAPEKDAPLEARFSRAAQYLQSLGIGFRWYAEPPGGWALRTECAPTPEGTPSPWTCDLHRAMLVRLLDVPSERITPVGSVQGGCLYRLGLGG